MEESKQASPSLEVRKLLEYAYYHFNRRNIDRLMLVIHPNVHWANILEGGHIDGQQALGVYWADQWVTTEPQVTPIEYSVGKDDTLEVKAHHIIRDKEGNVVLDRKITHSYTLEDMKIKTMDIIS